MKSINVMKAIGSGSNPVQASQQVVTKGDAVWLSACRNSPVSVMPMYQRTLKAARAACGRLLCSPAPA